MPNAALELNDACLAIARGEAVTLAGPGCAALVGGELRFGEEACAAARGNPREAQRRYWAQLSEAPLPHPLGRCRSAADLVHEHLARLWAACPGSEAAVLVAMPGWTTTELALLLGIARDAGVPVAGLVDAAVAASRAPCPGRALWHLQATLDAAWVTRIRQESGAVLGERERVGRVGIDALERGVADFVARRFVERSRFDPLHDAASEQALYGELPAWLQALGRQERVDAVLEHRGNRYEARLEAAALREWVARIVEPVTQRLRALVSPREPAMLLVHHRLADFPGLVEALLRIPACVVALLEPGAAARGALRVGAAAAANGGVRLVTTLPWDQPPAEPTPMQAGGQVLVPTHVVYRGRAWSIAAAPVQVGTELDDGEHGIRLEAGAQAVSRRHCTIRLEDGRVMVHDQSRYGTLLNGHRIEGTAALQAGDVLGIGRPPRELALVAEVPRAP